MEKERNERKKKTRRKKKKGLWRGGGRRDGGAGEIPGFRVPLSARALLAAGRSFVFFRLALMTLPW